MRTTTISEISATIRVNPEAVAAAAGQARQRAVELDAARADVAHALSAAAAALDPASRAALVELVQAWGLLGAQLATASGGLAASLAASAQRYHAAEQALAGTLGPVRS